MESKVGDDCNSKKKFFNVVEEFPTVEDGADEVEVTKATRSSEFPLENGLHRRSFTRFGHRGLPFDGSKDSNCNSLPNSIINPVPERIIFRDRRNVILSALNDREKVSEGRSNYPRFQLSSNKINGENKQNQENFSLNLAKRESLSAEIYDYSLSFLFLLAGLVIKAIGFQVSLFISFFTFPVWFLYCSFMFVVDPFRILNWAKKRTIEQLVRMSGCICDGVFGSLKQHSKLVIRLSWGFFWSAYVCFLLFGFLVLGFVIGAVAMRYVVVEPIQITENLNFDYTKSSPVALVPIISCPSVSCGVNCTENVEIGKSSGSSILPQNHKSQLAILLALPESEYNRKLGVFQVRVDFLSVHGKVTASSSYPCMLQFKSQTIRYLETFLMSAPLLAGYSSESQTLNLKMRSFTEGNEPTSCLKVILEQRAEYRPGAGIPEIYTASLVLESQLPLIKRIVWYWRKTIFIWASMVSFMMELMLILVCCRPIIIPRPSRSYGSAKIITPINAITWVKGN